MITINNKKLVLKFDGSKLISTNHMYTPIAGRKKKGTNRRTAYLTKSYGLKKFQRDFDQQIRSKGYDKLLEEFKEKYLTTSNSAIKLTYLLGMPYYSIYYKRPSKDDYVRPNDLTNYIKSAEDSLGKYLKDDKYNFEVHSVKYELPEDRNWEFYMIIEPIEDYKIYNEEYIKDQFL